VQITKVDSAGSIGAYSTPTTFNATARLGMASVASNGYLYIMAGQNVSGGFQNNGYYAAINPDGSLGTWNTWTSSLEVRTGATAVAYGTNLYLIGGAGDGSGTTDCNFASGTVTYCTKVQRATINPSNGQLTWSGSYTYYVDNARNGLAAAIVNGYLYVIGGIYASNATPSSEVDFAQINSDGTLGTFAKTTAQLGTARGDGVGAVAFGGSIYVVGGRDVMTAEYATPTAGGQITSWTPTGGSLNLAAGQSGTLRSMSVTGAKGYIYVTGGLATNSGVNAITQVARINSDGSLGSWSTSAQLMTNTRYSHGSVAYNGFLYVMGGCKLSGCPLNSQVNNDVQYAPIGNGGTGNVGPTTANTNSLQTARAFSGSFVSNGYMYVVGGTTANPTNADGNTVEYAPINADGSVGAFQYTNTLQDTIAGAGYALYNGYLYKLGGVVNGTFYNYVQYAAICTGSNITTGFATNCTTSSTPGTTSTWAYTSGSANTGSTPTSGFNTARSNMEVQAYGGYLYILGGCTGARAGDHQCNTVTNTVEAAPLNANGTVGTWTTLAGKNFTIPRKDATSQVTNGYVYIMSGCTGFDGFTGACNASANDVQYAKFSSGTLANDSGCGTVWCTTSPFTTARYRASSAVSNGYLYILGGVTSGVAADIQYAPIQSNGALGQWMTASNSFTTARHGQDSVINNGDLYVIGGCTNVSTCASAVLGTVQYLGQLATPRVGQYSKLIDLGATSNITNFSYNGSLPGGLGSISYKAAPSGSTIYTKSGTMATVAGGTQCTGLNGVRYLFITITLDDSANTAFADTSTTSANITDFTIKYEPQRLPQNRLRLGQIMQNGVLSDLDICKL
jgi:hypothetical protein